MDPDGVDPDPDGVDLDPDGVDPDPDGVDLDPDPTLEKYSGYRYFSITLFDNY